MAIGTVQLRIALLATVAMALFTTSQCNNNTTSWPCNGLTDAPCLIGHIDLGEDLEFMMDAEISRRILVGGSGYTGKVLNSGASAACDRKGYPPCHPDSNRNPPPPRCDKTRYNRECYRY